jgi:hypothetical protein
MRSMTADRTSALGPEDLTTLYRAFDAAWDVVKSHHTGNPQSIEAGRLRLANVVLAAYRDGVVDPADLTETAIRWMDRPYLTDPRRREHTK